MRKQNALVPKNTIKVCLCVCLFCNGKTGPKVKKRNLLELLFYAEKESNV